MVEMDRSCMASWEGARHVQDVAYQGLTVQTPRYWISAATLANDTSDNTTFRAAHDITQHANATHTGFVDPLRM